MKAPKIMEKLNDVARLIAEVCEDLLINDLDPEQAEEAMEIVDELRCELEEVKG